MIRRIRLWPDPVLKETCAPVAEIDDSVRKLAKDMLDTMYFAEGRGLAAPQVGEAIRLFVADVTWKEGEKASRVFVNPTIIAQSEETVAVTESCLSIPGISAEVARPSVVRVRWSDLDGVAHEEQMTGASAVIAQHEIDHLDGIVTLDRISPEARFQLERMYAG